MDGGNAQQDTSQSPGDMVRAELAKRNWTQEDLARVLGRPQSRVNELVQGKLAVSPELALGLEAAFGLSADEWIRAEASYRLALASVDTADVKRQARLYGYAPIREMQKRGWIKSTDDTQAIEQELANLFEVKSLDDEPAVVGLFRRSSPNSELTPSQRAWYFRVRQLARCVAVDKFRPERLAQCERDLRKLAAYSKEARKVPGVLAHYGIRYVVVEPLGGTKIDGMATWLDENSPVIGMSLRFDRIDGYWHTLCHELQHIEHRDELSIDDNMSDPGEIHLQVKPEMERRADDGATDMLIGNEELKSFILRVSPLYSKARINQFANRIKLHPGIIVGQLQHRGEIGFHANREMLVKIRDSVIPVALTDGWGHSIDERTLR